MKKEKAQKKKKEKEEKKVGDDAKPQGEELVEIEKVEEEIPTEKVVVEGKEDAKPERKESNNKENDNPNKEKKEDEDDDEEEEEEPPVVDCDLLFIMDCTGSMSSYINMCRT